MAFFIWLMIMGIIGLYHNSGWEFIAAIFVTTIGYIGVEICWKNR